MKCPQCRGALTRAQEWPAGVAACGHCGGVWLDNSATAQLLAGPDDSVVELARSTSSGAADKSVNSHSPRPCAICETTMVMTQVTNTAVQVDVCSEHGTWFDPHELEALAAAADAGHALGGQEVAASSREGATLSWLLRQAGVLLRRQR